MSSFLADPQGYPYRAGNLFLGLDAKGREIGVSTDRHAITIAGSRSGKGACLLIPNALRWPHNLLVVDPKGEVAAASWEAREALGQSVHVLDPFKVADVPDRLRASFNPLAAIDPQSLTAREDIQVIADGLVKRSDPKHEEWYAGAVGLLAGLMAYAVETAPHELRSFAGVRALLLQPSQDLYATAQLMLGCTAFGGLAREAGVMLMTACESEKAMEKDFLGTARRATSWMDSPAVADVLASSSFNLSDLKSGAVSVFLVLPPQYLDTHGAFLRLFVRAAMSGMMQDGAKVNRRCLFLLDEFAALGRLDVVAKGMGLMAGYGLHLWPFLQDLGQLRDLYRENVAETFFGNADVATFFGNSDQLTLEYISRRIGNITAGELDIFPPLSPKPIPDNSNLNAALAADHADAMTEYHRLARVVGEPRVAPSKLARILAKGVGDTVARSMIAFTKGGDILHILPAPYFHDARPLLLPMATNSPAVSQQHTAKQENYREWRDASNKTKLSEYHSDLAKKRASSTKARRGRRLNAIALYTALFAPPVLLLAAKAPALAAKWFLASLALRLICNALDVEWRTFWRLEFILAAAMTALAAFGQ